jgi:hypothetical protein
VSRATEVTAFIRANRDRSGSWKKRSMMTRRSGAPAAEGRRDRRGSRLRAASASISRAERISWTAVVKHSGSQQVWMAARTAAEASSGVVKSSAARRRVCTAWAAIAPLRQIRRKV